ncbi:MAG: glycosyltransferase family 4 protein [Planctomycetes bacterium]|nr:glycosyltransferase family 4 protein [Planctomycetota bacterium]
MPVKNILMISQVFPPAGGGGVQRTLKFVKYLPQSGWHPTVLTLKPDSRYPKDHSMLAEIPHGVHTVRTGQCNYHLALALLKKIGLNGLHSYFTRFLAMPDSMNGWISPAFFRALQLCRERKFDAIYTTAPAYSTHIIGLLLSKRTHIPWAADFRDEWTSHSEFKHLTAFHYKLHKQLEASVIANASAVISASPNVTDYFQNQYTGSEDKYHTITNGFDPEDFKTISAPACGDDGKMKITFIGSVYGYVDPVPFLNAVKELIDAKKIQRDKLVIKFVGNFWIPDNAVKQYSSLYEILPYTDHLNAVARMAESDLLLVLLRRSLRTIPAKIFEYFAVNKPVLAIVPQGGIAAELVTAYKAGFTADPENPADIKESVLKAYNLWSDKKLCLQPNEDFVKTFDRRLLTQKLAKILDGIEKGTKKPESPNPVTP